MKFNVTAMDMDNGIEKEATREATRRVVINWKEVVNKRIPITQWLPKYTLALFLQDLLAGFTVALTEIPQGIAYAYVAGLNAEYGLYCGIMGCFMYAIFGSCKDVNIGPTAIMALMTQPNVEKLGADMAVLLAFLSGCIIFVLGLLHLGFLVEFFSYPVTAGFTSAASMTIAASQFKSLLGIPGKANAFLDAVISVYKNIAKSRKWDTVLGFTTIIALVFMREFKNFGTLQYKPEWSKKRNVIGRILMLLSLSRNALAVLVGTAIAYCLARNGHKPFILTGKVGEGLPPFGLPPFSTTFNGTHYSFGDMAEALGGSIAFVPLIAVLESVAIAKAFAKGKTLDATQEMLALGLSNIAGSFVRSMPVTGSFTRTAVNNASGAQTTFGGFITGAVLLMALAFLTKTFYYIPKATLAAVVICAMFYLFDREAIKLLWRTKKIELIPFGATLLACIFIGLEYGILIGLGTNIVFVLYTSARPPVHVERLKMPQADVFLVAPSRSLQYPAAEYVRERVMKDCDASGSVVVVDGKYIRSIDATVAKNLKVLIDDVKCRGQNILFWNFKKSVIEVCLGIDPGFVKYFRDGPSLDDVLDDTPEIPSGDVRFTVQ